jgi:hypothetical protein
MSQITHLIVDRLVTYLTSEMRTKIPSSQPTRASLVQAYRFQDSPLESNIYIWVSGGNPNDTSFRDGRVSSSDMEGLSMNIPVGEIGGGHYWWRRGRVVVGCYFITQKYTQVAAANYAHIVLGRAIHFTERAQIADLVDEFGERAYMIAVYASTFNEGGGPPDQYLWRGEILWQALTHRPM